MLDYTCNEFTSDMLPDVFENVPKLRHIKVSVEDAPDVLGALAQVHAFPNLEGAFLVCTNKRDLESLEGRVAEVFAAKPRMREIVVVHAAYEGLRHGRAFRFLRDSHVTTYMVNTCPGAEGCNFGPDWVEGWMTPGERRIIEEQDFILGFRPPLIDKDSPLPPLISAENLDWNFVIQESLVQAAKRGDREGFRNLLKKGPWWTRARTQTGHRIFMDFLNDTRLAEMFATAKGPSSRLRQGEFAKMDWVQKALKARAPRQGGRRATKAP
jgi:hypothetical protein